MRTIIPKPRRLVSIASLTHNVENSVLSSTWWIHNQHLHTSSMNMNQSSTKKNIYKTSDAIPIAKSDNDNDMISNNSSFINSSISF
jgi:hypothetical protein